MSTLLKPISVRERLLNLGIRIFTPLEFTRIFPVQPHVTKYFLEKQVKEGLLLRLKPGLYTLKTDPPGEEEIANALYKPSYISFEYALAYYRILPEMPYTVTSATTKPTRLFSVQNKEYSFRTLKESSFAGYVLQKNGNRSFLIAEPEKALVDYFYFVYLNQTPQNDRFRLQNLNRAKIMNYAKLFTRPGLIKLLNKIL